MVDINGKDPRQRAHELARIAVELDVYPGTVEAGHTKRLRAVAWFGQNIVRTCTHCHRDDRAARKCAVKLVHAIAAEYDAETRLFS